MQDDDLATLTDIDTVEVSLVDSGAVARTFAFRKRDANMAMDILTAIAGTKLEKESDVTAVLQKASIDDPDVREALMTACKLLQANRDQLTDKQLSDLLAAAGAPTANPDNQPDAADDNGEGDGKDGTSKSDDDDAGDDDDDSEDDDDKKTEQQKRNKKVAKQNAELNKRYEDLQKQAKQYKAELAEVQKGFQAERDKRLDSEAVDLAKSAFPLMGGHAEFGATIRKMQKAGVWDDVAPLFSTLNERLKKSALFGEAGHGQAGAPAGDDNAKIENIAKSLREKDPTISLAKSRSLAWQTPEGREIYKSQDAERHQRR